MKGSNHSSFVIRNGRAIESLQSVEGVVEVDLLISSGLLIRSVVLHDVGLVEAGLFIDGVDSEWCLRAKSHDYSMFGVAYARMEHDLGDIEIYDARLDYLNKINKGNDLELFNFQARKPNTRQQRKYKQI